VGFVNSHYLPGVSNEPNQPVRCCTFPSTRSQRCMPLFDSHLAHSAGAASVTPGGPLSARAGCPPSLSCPFWAGRIAARRVTPASSALPTRRSNEDVCRPPSLIRLGDPVGPHCARPAPLARLNRHSEAYCHAGPTRLARKPVAQVRPRGAVSSVYPVPSSPAGALQMSPPSRPR
jgi:hypothetical protein